VTSGRVPRVSGTTHATAAPATSPFVQQSVAGKNFLHGARPSLLKTTAGEGGWSVSGVSIVRRRNGTCGLLAYAGIDPATGKERRKWLGTYRNEREAERAREAMAHHPLFSSGIGPYGSPRLRTGDYLTAWADERRALGTLRERTAKTTKTLIRLYLAPSISHIPLARLGPPAIQTLYITLLNRGLAPATVVRASGVLHAALEDAVHRGLIRRNPQDATTLPKVPRHDPTVPTLEQVLAYLDDSKATATPAVYALDVTAVATGARPGELLGLPDSAVDLTAGTLRIGQTLVYAGAVPVYGQPKTDAGWRTVRLPAVAMDAIRAAITWKKAQRLKLGSRFRDAGLLFCGPQGRPLNINNLRRRDHLPRLRRLKLPDGIRLYDFRHFHVSELVAAGLDYRTVADRVGHRNPAFTIRTYAHARQRAQERAAEVANEMLTTNRGVAR
jgi:integrase